MEPFSSITFNEYSIVIILYSYTDVESCYNLGQVLGTYCLTLYNKDFFFGSSFDKKQKRNVLKTTCISLSFYIRI